MKKILTKLIDDEDLDEILNVTTNDSDIENDSNNEEDDILKNENKQISGNIVMNDKMLCMLYLSYKLKYLELNFDLL